MKTYMHCTQDWIYNFYSFCNTSNIVSNKKKGIRPPAHRL